MGLALPLSFQFLMWALVPACDAFMLGRVGQNEMAAVSLALQVPFLMYMLVAAFAVGMSVLGAQYHGRGDSSAVGRVFALGLVFLAAVSWLFALAAIFVPSFLMTIFTDEKELIGLGAKYLRIAGFAYLIVGFSHSFHTILKATGRARFSVAVSVGAAVLNVALNALFIFGAGPIRPMGVEGAALATLVTIAVEAVVITTSSLFGRYVEVDWRRFFGWNRGLVCDYLKCSLPILGAYAVWGVGLASYTAILGHLGCDAAAANAVVMVVRDLLCCLCEGGASAASIIVGHELGRGNLTRGRIFGAKIVRISVALGAGCVGLALAVLPIICHCVILTEAAKTHLIGMMLVLSGYLFGRYVNTIVIAGIFTAGGDTMFDFYSLTVTMWGLAVPLALLGAFVFHWPAALVFACTCVDEVGKLPWTWAHYRRYLWVKDLTRSFSDGENLKV